MRKASLLFVLVMAIVSIAATTQQQQSAAVKKRVSGGTCPADGSPSASNDGATATATWGAATRQYAGQADWTDGGTPRTICKLAFEITGVSGASSSTFVATIWEMSAGAPTYNLGTLVATSTGVTGVDAWSETWVVFEFASPFTTTANQRYALLVGPTVARAANDMTAFMDNTALTGYRDTFSSVGAADNAGGNDVSIRIYWQ